MRYPKAFVTIGAVVCCGMARCAGAAGEDESPKTLEQVREATATHAERARLFHEQALKDVADFHASAAYPGYLGLRTEFAAAAELLQRAEDEGKDELVREPLKQQVAALEGKLREQVRDLPELARLERLKRQADELAAGEEELSRTARRHQLLLTGLDFLFERINELRQAHQELEARIAEKEKELPKQEGEVRLRNATYLANARKASTDMGLKIKELQTGREKIAAELRRLGGVDEIDKAAENVRREHDAIVELFNDAQWFVDEAAFMAKAHATFPTRASVSTIEGGVVLRRANGDVVKPSLDMTIRNGDVIETGKDGRAEFVFPDGRSIKIGPNSTFKLQRDLGEQGALKSGWFRFREALRTNGESERVRRYRGAHVAVAVRGTDFIMKSDHDGTTVLVRTGEVEVLASDGKGVRVVAGQRLTVDAAGTVSPTTPVSEAEYRRMPADLPR